MAVKLTSSDLPALIEKLKKGMPQSLNVYYLMKNSHRTDNAWPNLDVYVDSEDVQQVTSMVAVWYLTRDGREKWHVCYTVDAQRLRVLIRRPGVFDVRGNDKISINCENLAVDVLAELVDEMGLDLCVIGPAHTHILDSLDSVDQAARREIPANFRIAPLEPEHGRLIHDAYRDTYGPPHAVESYENTIRYQRSLAIYNEHGHPVSWVTVKEWGDIGNTYTAPAYQRRGFATILTAKLAQILHEAGEIPFVKVNVLNQMSIAMHAKIGFKETNSWNTMFKFKSITN